jgi:hypothetical protein
MVRVIRPIAGAERIGVSNLSPYLFYILIWLAITVPAVIIGWVRVFPKANQPWWAALIPGYNVYVLVVGVAQLSLLWFILVLIPGVQIIAVLLVNLEVAKRFGRSEGFGIGLAVLGFIFYPVLGFSDAKYQK